MNVYINTCTFVCMYTFLSGRTWPHVYVCEQMLLKIRTPTQSRTSKKDGNGQADCSGKSHGKRLVENASLTKSLVMDSRLSER